MKTTDTIMEFIGLLKEEKVYNDKVFRYIGFTEAYRTDTVKNYHITLEKEVMNNTSYRFEDWLDNNTEVLVYNGFCLVTKDKALYIRIE